MNVCVAVCASSYPKAKANTHSFSWKAKTNRLRRFLHLSIFSCESCAICVCSNTDFGINNKETIDNIGMNQIISVDWCALVLRNLRKWWPNAMRTNSSQFNKNSSTPTVSHFLVINRKKRGSFGECIHSPPSTTLWIYILYTFYVQYKVWTHENESGCPLNSMKSNNHLCAAQSTTTT